MYNKYLPLFIEVANAGSFSKASEKLYISVPAIIKQINHLEDDLQITLFQRSHTGLKLTKEGQFLYEKAQYMIEYSNSVLKQAKAISYRQTKEISIGRSQLRHFNPYINAIKRVRAFSSDFHIHVVSFDDQRNEFDLLLNDLGKNIDGFFGIYSSTHFKQRASIYHICYYRIVLAISINNPLSSKTSLSFDDLKNHKIIMVERGDTAYIDQIRDIIENKYPEIEIINVPSYDIDTFNFCNSIEGVMISVDIWDQIHPLLVNVPLSHEFYVPYGFIYPLNPSKKIIQFIDCLKKEIEKK